MSGIVFDELGNTLNVGDLVAVKGNAYKILAIDLPKGLSIVDPTIRNPMPTIKIVAIRLIHDITIQAEAGKKIRELYKIDVPRQEPPSN